MKSRRRRLHILCEDELHVAFVERLAARWDIGPRQRKIDASPRAPGSAAKYVLDHYVDAVRNWRAESHDANVGLLVVIDGDQYGLVRRRQELARKLKDANHDAIRPSDPVAIFVPTWHIETWIAWLCGHRPVDQSTRYKDDHPAGHEVARRIKSGEYSAKLAVAAWEPPTPDEAMHVPTLTDARNEVSLLGV